MANKNLNKAKEAKKDEFYTQLEDINNEVRHYRKHFKRKTVLCNCDDPRVSNFFKYFAYNFEFLGLKKLIATCYKNQDVNLFSDGKSERAVYLIYEGIKNGNHIPDDDEIQVLPLKGDGDFRSPECIEFLKEADIIVTNPPFSLFREYVSLLMKYDKKFLIIGNINAIKYKEIFPLLQQNRIWIGNGFNLSLIYKTPYNNELEANRKFVSSKGYDPDQNYIKVPGVAWYTNLDHKRRHEDVILYKSFSEEEYPIYENYDAIDVKDYNEIPFDYEGVMGVPFTFMGKYNPDQFEVIGLAHGNLGVKAGLKPYDRTLKKLNKGLRDGDLYYLNKDMPVIPYTRVLIRKKKS